MPLFTEIKEIKDHIGGAGNVSLHIKSIGPHEYPTFCKHLQKWIGNELYDTICANPALYPTLYKHLCKTMAFLLMYEYSFVSGIQISEQGNIRYEGEEKKGAYKYQMNAYRCYMLDTGYNCLEELLKYLDKNADTHSIWKNSTAFKCSRANFLNYACEFRAVYSHYLSRYTFEHLRPLISDLETFAILPCLGEDLFHALKAEIKAGTIGISGCVDSTATDCQQKRGELVQMIQSVLANFVIEEGIKRHWVQFDKGNIVHKETQEPQSFHKTSTGKNQPIAQKQRHHDEWGNRHLSYLTHFLEAHASCFPEYTPNSEDEDEKDDKCCIERMPCGCHDHCSCSTSNAKKGSHQAIVLL